MNILVDASNVLFWEGGGARLRTVETVAGALRVRRLVPCLVFDYRAGLAPSVLAARLGLSAENIHVCEPGMPADRMLLTRAQAFRLQIVSRDQFRDWRGHFPTLRRDWLVTGRVGKGKATFSRKLRLPSI